MALPLYVERHDSNQKKYGSTHPNTLKSLHDLAISYSYQSMYTEAGRVYTTVAHRVSYYYY